MSLTTMITTNDVSNNNSGVLGLNGNNNNDNKYW